jgi:WD40 repeat protein
MRTGPWMKLAACATAVIALVFASSSAVWAQKPIDASKLKRGDKLEYQWGLSWHPAEFVQRDTFNRVKIRDASTGRVSSVSIDEIRLPRGAKQKSDGEKGTAAHPDNPFATGDEKASALKPRTWSDKSGKFKIEGTLVRIEGANAILLRSDKKEIPVPLDKLSDADQKYVADYQAGKSLDGKKTASDEEEDAYERELLPLTKTDLNSAKLIEIDGTPEWSYKPDGAANIVPLRDVRVGLKSVDFFAKASQLLLLPQDKKAFVVFKNGRPGQDATSVVQACDLGRGKLEATAVFGIDELPIAISPDGKYVLSRTDKFGFGQKGELRLYGREGKKVSQIACWQPYNHHRWERSKRSRPSLGLRDKGLDNSEEAEEDDPLARPELWVNADVEWAEFIDNNHLLTMSEGGELAMWKVPEVEPLYVIKARLSQPALSPGKNFLAVAVKEGIAILRTRDGEPVGLIPMKSDNSSGSIAFRPDGKRLVLVQGGQWSRVRVWDLESQEIVRDFAVKGVSNSWSTHATWTTEDHLLTGSTVVDLVRRIPIWRYTSLSDAWQFYGGKAWYVTGGLARDNQVLASAIVPPKASIEAVAKLNPEDLLVIRPGMEVEVDLQGGNPEDLKMAHESVLKRLEENEMRIVPQSKLRLVGRIQPGETKSMKYAVQKRTIGGPFIPPPSFGHRFGSPSEPQQISEHSVTEQVLTLSFEIDGKSVWKHEKRTTPPYSLIVPEGKTLDQVLAEHMQQNAQTFGQIWVPSYVAEIPGGEDQKAAGAIP